LFPWCYPEQSTYSSNDFIKHAVEWLRRREVLVECVQTDNGFEFTYCFINTKRNIPTMFEAMLEFDYRSPADLFKQQLGMVSFA